MPVISWGRADVPRARRGLGDDSSEDGAAASGEALHRAPKEAAGGVHVFFGNDNIIETATTKLGRDSPVGMGPAAGAAVAPRLR